MGMPSLLNPCIQPLKNDPIPTHYLLDNGWAAKACDTLEKPNNLYSYLDNKDHRYKVITMIAMAVLYIPAAIGNGASRFIHWIASEKIKRDDYNSEFDKWMTKKWIGESERACKRFIDFCIQNRIRADDCPHKYILHKRRCIDNEPLYLFEPDGPFCGVENDLVNESALVLWDSACVQVDYELLKRSEDSPFYKDRFNSPKQSRDFFIKNIACLETEARGKPVLGKCNFVFFNYWTDKSKSTVKYIREAAMTSPIKV